MTSLRFFQTISIKSQNSLGDISEQLQASSREPNLRLISVHFRCTFSAIPVHSRKPKLNQVQSGLRAVAARSRCDGFGVTVWEHSFSYLFIPITAIIVLQPFQIKLFITSQPSPASEQTRVSRSSRHLSGFERNSKLGIDWSNQMSEYFIPGGIYTRQDAMFIWGETIAPFDIIAGLNSRTQFALFSCLLPSFLLFRVFTTFVTQRSTFTYRAVANESNQKS